MPNQDTHISLSVLTAPVSFSAGYLLTPDAPLLGGTIAAAAHVASEVVLSPDLDLATSPLWWPYALLIPHRHWLSHGLIIGPLLRLAYLLGVLALLGVGVLAALGVADLWRVSLQWLWHEAYHYRQYAPAALTGLVFGGAVHSVADWLTTGAKRTFHHEQPAPTRTEQTGGSRMGYVKGSALFLAAAVCTAWLAWPDTPLAAPVASASMVPVVQFNWHAVLVNALYLSLLVTILLPVWLLIGVPLHLKAKKQIALKQASGKYPANLQTLHVSNNRSTSYAPKYPNYPASAFAPPPLELPALPASTLPELVRLADVRGNTPPGRLALGVTFGGKLLSAPPNELYHALFHGQTRSGKTTSVNSVFTQLHHMAAQGIPLQLYAGDRKGEFAQTWDGSPLFPDGIQTQTVEIADMLEGLLNDPAIGLLARNRLFKRTRAETGRLVPNIDAYEAVTGNRLPRMFIFVDEINALMLEAGKNDRLSSALMQVLQMGASAGYYLLGGAQHLKDSVLGTEGKNQFFTRAHYGNANPNAIGMLFGKVDLAQLQPHLDGSIKGRGLLSTAGGDNPVPFQAPLCTEGDILGAIAAVQRPQIAPSQPAPLSTTDHQAHQEQTPIDIPVPAPAAGTGALGVGSVTAERKAIIQRLHRHGISQNQIISTVYGIKKGSNPTYFAARDEIREALRELEETGV